MEPDAVRSEAWARAHEAAAAAGVRLRALRTLAEADGIVRVMMATWGEQLVRREMVRALGDSGNEPWGAFDGGELVGFVLGWMGEDPEVGRHVHSHLLATLPEWRGRGVGYALKLAQRAQALDRGIHVVRWTADPLMARNAHFNIVKLGAVCDRFHRDFYGDMTDVLNRGERSDRLVVRWDLDREPTGPAPAEGVVVLDAEAGVPVEREGGVPPVGVPVLVRIPREYQELRERDAMLAARWREVVGNVIDECFATGRIVTGFTSDSAYVLA
jgi:predicted GNAT superfamily acetyltransferase